MVTKKQASNNHNNNVKGLFLLSVVVSLIIWLGIETVEYDNGSLCLNTYQSQKLDRTQLVKAGAASSFTAKQTHDDGKQKKEDGVARIISLAGQNFTCLPSYSDTYRNILLVMEFSGRTGQLEKDLEELYSCFFPHIKRYTFCDPNSEEEKANGMTCIEDPTPDFARKKGSQYPYTPAWFQYDFMADAMEKNPDFDGYLFMQDDLVLNFWNFPVRHDFSKVWRNVMFPDPDPDVWDQHRNLSLVRTDQYPPIAEIVINSDLFPIQDKIDFINGFSEEERHRLYHANSATGEPSFRMANTDVYYIPAKYREAVAYQLRRSRKYTMMNEVVVPIVLDALLRKDEYEVLSGAALYRVEDPVQKIGTFD